MPEPRRSILKTPFDPHGGPDGSREKLLDFSVNANPFGPPAALFEHLAKVDVSTYPDPSCWEARALAASHHEVWPSHITFGNGTADLIHRLAACYLEPGAKVLIATPTFGEYARASALYGAGIATVDVYTGRAALDEAALIAGIQKEQPTLVWLCHPNNPTGHAWHAEQLDAIADACAGADALLVVDVAYLELSNTPKERPPKGAVQLRSLTKTFCIPGLRIGYVVAPEPIIHALERAAPPWQTSAHAQAAAAWALSAAGRTFVQRTVPELLALRRDFQRQLRTLGYQVGESVTNFFLVPVGDATAFKVRAQGAGFRVRDCSSFGLPQMIRLATRNFEENAKLVDWLTLCSSFG